MKRAKLELCVFKFSLHLPNCFFFSLLFSILFITHDDDDCFQWVVVNLLLRWFFTHDEVRYNSKMSKVAHESPSSLLRLFFILFQLHNDTMSRVWEFGCAFNPFGVGALANIHFCLYTSTIYFNDGRENVKIIDFNHFIKFCFYLFNCAGARWLNNK